MKLKKLSYSEPKTSLGDDWVLEEVSLNSLNLIVGRNSSGKSRLLTLIKSFAQMLTKDNSIYAGKWNFSLINEGLSDPANVFAYELKSRFNGNILQEELKIGNEQKLLRNLDGTYLFSEETKKTDFIDPPDDKLVLHSRRDKKEYPFFESLVKWAQNVHYFNFGNIHAYSFLDETIEQNRLASLGDIASLVKEMTKETIEQVKKDFNSIGYSIDKLESRKISDSPEKNELFIKEGYLSKVLNQRLLSQGMYRALSVVIFINYLLNHGDAETIVIDDFCEGLDFERSTKLGKWLFEKLDGTNIQLIVTSNDYFLMEVVDIKYWNVLVRDKSVVRSLNYINNKELFDKFKLSGLGNFDFFASDYLLNQHV